MSKSTYGSCDLCGVDLAGVEWGVLTPGYSCKRHQAWFRVSDGIFCLDCCELLYKGDTMSVLGKGVCEGCRTPYSTFAGPRPLWCRTCADKTTESLQSVGQGWLDGHNPAYRSITTLFCRSTTNEDRSSTALSNQSSVAEGETFSMSRKGRRHDNHTSLPAARSATASSTSTVSDTYGVVEKQVVTANSVAECETDEICWEALTKVFTFPRNYFLMNKLAGIKGDIDGAVVQAKGLPEDATEYTIKEYTTKQSNHTPSWVTLEELREVGACFVDPLEKVEAVINYMADVEKEAANPGCTRLCFWFD